MHIAACIVAYFPDRSLLRKNIEALRNSVAHIYIWWNSPVQSLSDLDMSNISYLGDGNNVLIAAALNACLLQSKEDGFDYLLTMDQDSVFESALRFVELARKYLADNIIAYTPNINGKLKPKGAKECIHIDYAFTSGSLCKVDSCIAIGGFREDYGIDWVDAEFNHRAQLNGYKLVCFPECNLSHHLGGSYGPFRYYHIFRNMIWMHREYPENPSLETVLYTAKFYLRALLKSKHIFRNLSAALCGFAYGIFHMPRKKLITE